MNIVATQEFLHGRIRFQQGQTYDVPGNLGEYFISQQWARAATDQDSPVSHYNWQDLETDAPDTHRIGEPLEIQDATLFSTSKETE